MDELLRARQFAAQRERRLAEAVRAGHEPDHAPAYGRPPRQPDPELVRQLAQAQHLREGLGARCLELSDRLLAAEDQQTAGRFGRPASAPAPDPGEVPGNPGPAPQAHRPAEHAASLVPPQRPFPTGARFGGEHRAGTAPDTLPRLDEPAGTTASAADTPAADAPPLRGARFRVGRPLRAARRNEERAATEQPHPGAAEDAAAARHTGPGNDRAERPGTSWASTRKPGDGVGDTRVGSTHPNAAPDDGAPAHPGGNTGTAAPVGGARSRSRAELIALVQRITDLHRQGSVHESAAIVSQVALMITPADLVRLATLLRAEGPAGSSTYLARSVASGTPEHATATLAVLRQEGLVDEAADLFHTLWSVSAQALPALLAALEESGQSADGQTLLWERASAPAGELSELTRCLRAAGRPGDTRHLLRQAAGRPAGEVAAIAAALDEESATELIGELVRLRSASDVGQFAAAVQGSVELYDALLFAADDLDESRARSAFAALRTAGLPTQPAPRPRKSRQRR
ncbi:MULTISPECIES: hypothetical protein [Kitasatospora]|uniref:Uncharacterized protein n=1 Tax=Kitasatospora setae (strain ATCC 33774 / DSM 43861 / JCM 3304 / KCC A-0304 / NBRC 14216 / KM-6054) TaxID=452652 RepID=E4NAX0_KITSK|nr:MULTISPECIES: hypothetical protein [Kitasatospora]BAJ28351.1 hypothetical protein KSE_25380 [Kitasatospora setae KM-6054]